MQRSKAITRRRSGNSLHCCVRQSCETSRIDCIGTSAPFIVSPAQRSGSVRGIQFAGTTELVPITTRLFIYNRITVYASADRTWVGLARMIFISARNRGEAAAFSLLLQGRAFNYEYGRSDQPSDMSASAPNSRSPICRMNEREISIRRYRRIRGRIREATDTQKC